MPTDTNGANGHGRTAGGRFAKGNPGGPGNPNARQTAQLRALIAECATPDELRAILTRLLSMARAGDMAAIREVLDRVGGKPSQTELIERVERLEHALLQGDNDESSPSNP